jgi:hypothetical protein
MKALIILSLFLTAQTSSAHEIEGTQMLKGSRDTKIYLQDVKTKCSLDVEKVKNLMEEDRFGNPAYIVRVELGLSGKDKKKKIEIKFKKKYEFNNLFKTAKGTEVRDFEYASPEGASLKIDRSGRVTEVHFPFEGETINCLF